VSAGRVGLQQVFAALAVGLLLALGALLLDDGEPDENRGVPTALRQEAIRQIEALPLLSVRVAEIDCHSRPAGHLVCPALLKAPEGSGRVVFRLGRSQERGKLAVESIKLTPGSAGLIRGQIAAR